MLSRRVAVTCAVIVAVLVGAWALARGTDSARIPSATIGPTSATTPPAVTAGQLGGLVTSLDEEAARQLLGELSVPNAVDPPGYDRDAYGEAWTDTDGNGCNQRDDVLLRDVLVGTVRVAPQGGCDHDVLAGEWLDPYTGEVVGYDDLKDAAQAQSLTIDHVVPLAEAHRSGASAWNEARRVSFANALDNLVAVDGPANSAKGDQDPATWRPPTAVWCAHAAVWISVKTDWSLSVDAAERMALGEMLDVC